MSARGTQKQWSAKTWALARETRDELARRFPDCITAGGKKKAKRPLKVGITNDLIRACPDIEKSRIKIAVALYTDGRRYNEAKVEGAVRIDLNGKPAGEVTAEEARHGEMILTGIATRVAKKALAA